MYIFIKGEDVPLNAPDSMFDQVAEAMSDFTNKKGDSVLKLANTTVKASEIKRLKKSETSQVDNPVDNHEQNRLAKEFEKELEPYLNPERKLTLEKNLEFLRDKGVISLKKCKPDGECKTATDFEMAVYSDRIQEYNQLEEKIQLWGQYKGRVNYAETKRLEEQKGVLAEGYGI